MVSERRLQLGAIRFDGDLRSVTTYLSSQTAFGDAREKFSRLQQISILLNLDSVRGLGPLQGVLLTSPLHRKKRLTNSTTARGLHGN